MTSRDKMSHQHVDMAATTKTSKKRKHVDTLSQLTDSLLTEVSEETPLESIQRNVMEIHHQVVKPIKSKRITLQSIDEKLNLIIQCFQDNGMLSRELEL